jgi:sterol desaturase/sphingolipid hydroxylase (fatty acid hydroxylase superfamily)
LFARVCFSVLFLPQWLTKKHFHTMHTSLYLHQFHHYLEMVMEYLNQKEMKWEEDGGNCKMRSSMPWTVRKV